MRRNRNEINRHGFEVFDSESQFEREGDLRHQPAGAGPGEQRRDELRRRGVGRQAPPGNAYVWDRIDGHWRPEQKRRGTRPESSYGGAAAKAGGGGGLDNGNSGCGVGGYRCRSRKRAAVNLRRDSPPKGVATRPPLPFHLPATPGGSSRG